jgi:DNA-binding NarL/FixJ family response regulator
VTVQVISRATARSSRRQAGPTGAGPEALSDTDLAIIDHLSSGRSNKEIGALVHLSTSTVKDHLERISAALGVHTRAAIVGEALRRGLI